MLTSIASFVIIAFAISIYLFLEGKRDRENKKKILKSKETGLHEPVTIHPYIDPAKCIGSGACVTACHEKDVLGLVDGRARNINSGSCIGHGACAAACPVGAITLVFGTETRGVEIPVLTPDFQTNISGIFIAGELGGMGLIKNAVTQGREAIEYITCRCKAAEKTNDELHDVVIVGSGPAGISASLQAIKNKLKFVTIEQDDIGGSVLHYPRNKIVMTSPMDLPMYGKLKLKHTTKEALMDLWAQVIKKSSLEIKTFEKMIELKSENGLFKVLSSKGEYSSRNVLLAIGRRGTPRKLGVPGEDLPKVAYKLLEPEQHNNQSILIVGGGNSAVEAALAVADRQSNNVCLSYRGTTFNRIKPENAERISSLPPNGTLKIMLESNVEEIANGKVTIKSKNGTIEIPNDYVYIFAGGELPYDLLKKAGVKIEKQFGHVAK